MARAVIVYAAVVLAASCFNAVYGCGRRGGGRSGPPPDRSSPSLTCPDISPRIAESGQTYAWVSWAEPEAEDDRDGRIIPRRSGQGPNTRFSGTTRIGYSATDRSGNQASCSFNVVVTVVRCTASETIEHGYFIYHPGMDWRYGGVSRYGCYRGYVLNGHMTLECQIGDGVVGQWSAPTPSCERITCPTLLNINRATLTCTNGFRYESQCTYVCDEGYDVAPGVGRMRVCGHRGLWLGSEPTCLDVESPVWSSCPRNMIQYTNRGMTIATPTWLRPTVTDNSGEAITVMLAEGFEPGSSVGVGSYTVTYTAVDSAGNSARPCSFVINIRNVRCPRIYPTPYLVATCPNGYDWGDACAFSCEDDFDLIGLSTASCEAPGTPPLPQWTYGLNMPSCQGRVCPELSAPDNGALVCDRWLYGSFCKMYCSDDYDVPPSRASAGRRLFVCGLDTGQWNNQVPDCSRTRRGTGYNMQIQAHYFSGDCCDESVQLVLQERFIDILSSHLQFSVVCTLHEDECRVDNTRVVCGPECADDDARRKRSEDSFVLMLEAFAVIPLPEGLVGMAAYRQASQWLTTYVQALQDSGALEDLQIENITTVLQSFDYGRTELGCDVGYQATEGGACVGCEPGTYFDVDVDDCQPCPRGTYHDETSDDVCVPCAPGETTARAGAESADECEAACAAGTYSLTGTGSCSPCAQGTYTETMGSLACTECPAGTTTDSFGATAAADCRKYEITAVSSEDAQSYASFDSVVESEERLAIAFKLYVETSSANASVLEVQIEEDFGSFIVNEDLSIAASTSSCQFSTENTTQLTSDNWNSVYLELDLDNGAFENLHLNGQEIELTTDCVVTSPLPSGNMTFQFGHLYSDVDFGGKFSDVNIWNHSLNWDEITAMSSSCLPEMGGNMISWNDLRDAQLVGALIQAPSDCDVADDCTAEPCGEHPCIDSVSSYICNCNPGFTGVHCETDIDDCAQHACEDGATCLDGADDYTCLCPDDMRGRYCELEKVHGGWSEWGEYGPCSESCEGGVQIRNRTCTQPEPGEEGNDCEGSSSETQACNTEDCPVCDTLTPPDNGEIVCHVDLPDYKNCTLQCDDGYAFGAVPLPYYLCDATTTFYAWNFQADDNPHAQLPDCTAVVEAQDLASEHSVPYADMYCNQRNYAAHRDLVTVNMQSLSCVVSGTCVWSMDVHNCDRDDRRNKRSAQPISFDIYIRISPDQIPANLTNQDVIPVYDPLVNELIEAATELYNLIDSGNFTVRVVDDVYYVDGQEVNPIIICPYEGLVYDNFYCIPCGVGTYEEEGACYQCDYGTYQEETGQTSCEDCPEGLSTPGRGSRSQSECTVEVPVRDISDSSESSKESSFNLAAAVAVPVVLVVVLCVVIAVTYKVCMVKKKKSEKNYDMAEEEFKSFRNNKPPRQHTAKLRKVDMTASAEPLSTGHAKEKESAFQYEQPIASVSGSIDDPKDRPNTAGDIKVMEPEFKANSQPPLLHNPRDLLKREETSLTQRPITARPRTSPRPISVASAHDASALKDTTGSRPNSAQSVTGLAFKPGDALPFIDG